MGPPPPPRRTWAWVIAALIVGSAGTYAITQLHPAATVSGAAPLSAGPVVVAASPPAPAASAPLPGANDDQLSNERHYTNVDGQVVHSPAAGTDGSQPAGATAQCADATYSFSQHRQGTCSHHGGVSQWLASPGRGRGLGSGGSTTWSSV